MFTSLDLITTDFIKLKPQSTIREVLAAFIEYRSDIACVVDSQGLLVGITTKYVIYRALLAGATLKYYDRNIVSQQCPDSQLR